MRTVVELSILYFSVCENTTVLYCIVVHFNITVFVIFFTNECKNYTMGLILDAEFMAAAKLQRLITFQRAQWVINGLINAHC